MQTDLNQAYSRRKAILFQAGLFGLWHFVWHILPLDLFSMVSHVITSFVIGLLFGYFYSESRNLVPLILAHVYLIAFPLDSS